MAVTGVHKDTDNLTLTITARFDAPRDRAWQLWADPRQLERWWGPPTYPATVTAHDLSPGGDVAYRMTGPEGDTSCGWWRIVAVDPPRSLEFDDGFADADGNPDPSMPTMRIRVELTDTGGVTEMSVRTTFPSAEAMEQMISMGMDEGMALAMGQMDAVLAG